MANRSDIDNAQTWSTFKAYILQLWDQSAAAQGFQIAAGNSAAAAASSASSVAAGAARLFADDATGLDATAEGSYYSIPSGLPDEVSIIKRKVGGTAVDTTKRTPSAWAVALAKLLIQTLKDKFDASFNVIRGPYVFAERDSMGRMSRYVKKNGRTWLKLDETVVLPGNQIPARSIPTSALVQDFAASLLPPGNSFGTARGASFVYKDANNRASELSLGVDGRFPKWVAQALFARAGGNKALSIGRSVRIAEVYLDVSGLPNGNNIPMDTGQTSLSYGVAPLYVSNGKLVHDALRYPNNGGYLEVATVAKVNHFGCGFVFPPGSELSAIALVLPSGTWQPNPGSPTAGIHYVFTGDGSWECAFLNPGNDRYAAGRVADFVCNGATRHVAISIDGNTVTIDHADGTSTRFTDTRISPNISNLAIWELYEFANQPARAAFTSLWADSAACVLSRQDSRPAATGIQNFLSKRTLK